MLIIYMEFFFSHSFDFFFVVVVRLFCLIKMLVYKPNIPAHIIKGIQNDNDECITLYERSQMALYIRRITQSKTE